MLPSQCDRLVATTDAIASEDKEDAGASSLLVAGGGTTESLALRLTSVWLSPAASPPLSVSLVPGRLHAEDCSQVALAATVALLDLTYASMRRPWMTFKPTRKKHALPSMSEETHGVLETLKAGIAPGNNVREH